jgi:hypothetical protein
MPNYGAISIQDELTLIGHEGNLRTLPEHAVDTTQLRYHRERIYGK